MTRHGSTPRPVSTALAVVLATPVHLLTVALAAAGVVFLWPGTTMFQKAVGLGFVVLAYYLRPALTGRGPSTTEIDLGRCPDTAALIRQVAEAAGLRAPRRLELTSDPRADARVSGPGRHTLVIGAPLWTALTEPERIALLAHQVGHLGRGGVWLRWYVDGAAHTLRRWLDLVAPYRPQLAISPGEQVMMATTGQRDALAVSSAGGLFADIVAIILWPIRALGASYARLLDRLASPSLLHHARRADLVAVRVAGTAATVGWLETLLVLPALETSAHRAAATRSDVAAAIGDRMAAFDATQRHAARNDAGDRVDGAHPPTRERLDAVEAEPRVGPSVEVPAERWRGIEAELSADVDQELRRYADDLRFVH